MSSSGPSELRQNACRKAAQDLLASLKVAKPSEIDLEMLAYAAGRLTIDEGGLESSEGRLVATPKNGGSIRVKAGMNEGRKRFTIAHEIAHFVLHPLAEHDREHSRRDFTIWYDASEEAEANIFAAELLMPEFLFKPMSRVQTPSLVLIDKLALEFSASAMATAFQYLHYTNEQVALVVSEGERILWTKKAKDFWPRIQTKRVHPHSGAGEILAGKYSETKRMVRSPAYAWLENFSNDSEREIMEDSRLVEYYGQMITLLWMKEDLSD
jgi:Zn-dependent peptidase ImmA (M78 family)